MEKEFRLYNRFQCNFFHLVSGDLEPQQTKGLGLLLSKSDLALKLFFNLLPDNEKVDLKRINKIIVNCELKAEGYRADIILRLYSDNKPIKAYLIEAKSISKGANEEAAESQIEKYKESFGVLHEFSNNICIITLTKYKSFENNKNSVSITWNDIINAFHKSVNDKKDDLLTDYFNYITNINNSMKFYEKEVLSIPAGNSHNLVKNSFVYERPANYSSFQKPLFLAFRKSGGGEMECLYSIDEIIVLNFAKQYNEFINSKNDENVINKLKKYVELANWETFPEDDKQVFILSDKVINFPEPYPRPEKNQAFTAYYELADMFDVDKKLKL